MGVKLGISIDKAKPRVQNCTEEIIEHWNRCAESNVTSGGLHVIIHEEKWSS